MIFSVRQLKFLNTNVANVQLEESLACGSAPKELFSTGAAHFFMMCITLSVPQEISVSKIGKKVDSKNAVFFDSL